MKKFLYLCLVFFFTSTASAADIDVDSDNNSKVDGAAEAVAVGWNSDVDAPQKNDIYDWLVIFDTDADGSLDDETISPTMDSLKLTKRTSAPGTPVAGEVYYADQTTWDPSGLGAVGAYYCIYDGANYIALFDEDGTWYVSNIMLPSYSHFATGDAVYSDTSTPHVLIAAETKNAVITNSGATQDRVYTLPAAEFGMNFMVMVIAGYQMDLEPDGTETLWLNGTQMAAGEHIQNTADTKGDVMSCWSVESGDGTYEVFCKSDNANFVEATP